MNKRERREFLEWWEREGKKKTREYTAWWYEHSERETDGSANH